MSFIFVFDLWKVCLSSMNFEKFYFYTWISYFYKKVHRRNSFVKINFFKVQGRKTKLMYSLGTKTIFWSKNLILTFNEFVESRPPTICGNLVLTQCLIYNFVMLPLQNSLQWYNCIVCFLEDIRGKIPMWVRYL